MLIAILSWSIFPSTKSRGLAGRPANRSGCALSAGRLLWAASLLVPLAAQPGFGQSDTEFTYQGLLSQTGQPAEGQFDISFTLWDADAGGNQIGGPINFVDLQVSGGLLTAVLDFGAGAFEGGEAHLEIVVDGVTLFPRQRITRAPLALQTRGLIAKDSPNNGLDVGVGTNNPLTRLHVAVEPVSGGQVNLPSAQALTVDNAGESYLGVLSGEGQASGILFQQLNGPGVITNGILFDHPDGPDDGLQLRLQNAPLLTVSPIGDVGIGTALPQALLHVKSGNSGAFIPGFDSIVLETDTSGQFTIAMSDTGAGGFFFRTPSGGLSGGMQLNPAYLSFSSWGGEAMVITPNDRVGIGTTNPQRLLHVADGTAGLSPNSNSLLVVERDFSHFINILCPDAFQSGLLFGNPSGGSAAGGIVFNSGNTPQGLQFRVNGNVTEMVLDAAGQLGINTQFPGFNLEVNGTAGKPGGGSWSNSSDQRLKKNIRPLTGALNTLTSIEGVRFEYLDPASINELAGERIGVIAQQVETVMPDWVDVNARGHKTVTFRGFEALTVEALKELRAEKDEQIEKIRREKDAEIEALSNRIAELEQMVAQLVAAGPEDE